METQKIWNNYGEEVYFFILKKVKDKNIAKDVFQNTFLKVHKNITSLKSEEKARPWLFQISRNEINNYFSKENIYVETSNSDRESPQSEYQHLCCFDKFINDLPESYREVIELVYLEGKKQKEVAEILQISLDNVKARIRRAKDILKKNFNECCKYEFDKNGNLIGEANCSICETH